MRNTVNPLTVYAAIFTSSTEVAKLKIYTIFEVVLVEKLRN